MVAACRKRHELHSRAFCSLQVGHVRKFLSFITLASAALPHLVQGSNTSDLQDEGSASSDADPTDVRHGTNTSDLTLPVVDFGNDSSAINVTNVSDLNTTAAATFQTETIPTNLTDLNATALPEQDIELTMSDIAASIAELRQQLQNERDKVEKLTARLDEAEGSLNESIDTGWLAYNTSLVFLMQMGFALVEAGSVRKKSYRHVFLKNLMDCSVGIALWLLVGYWIAFPGKWEGVVLEFAKFDMFFVAAEGRFFAFQTVFASTAITIISGAMAERTRMQAYLAFCGICSAMVYAVVVRWTWGGGWLSEFDVPYHDFAGSGVVHATGGAAAFVGAALVGPRAGRWEPETSLVDDDQYKPHSLDNILMGTFILWFGWFGFNPGSTTSLVGESADTAAIAYVNTMICPVFAAITVMLIGVTRHSWYKGPPEDKPPLFDLGKICNGVLGGLVGITAGCDAIPVEWTIIVGIVSGLTVSGWTSLCVKMRIDDPVDASAVHGACGVIGVLAVGFFHKDTGLCTAGDADLLVTQIKAILAIVGYVCGTAFVYFYVVHAFGYLRLDMLVEIMGIDRVDFAHIEHVDVSQLEIQALNRYRAKLLDRFEGHLWGITLEQAVRYAKMHRSCTAFMLILAMVYNYFFYIHFEWRGWDFFSVMNLAVGCQCAAASHAEYMCKAGEPAIRYCCMIVIIIGLGLAISNFIIAPHGNLMIAWLRTMTLSFSWSLWMHLRVHPVDWDQVCKASSKKEIVTNGDETAKLSYSKTDSAILFKGMFEMGSSQGCFDYLKRLILVGRFQHIGECTLSYASVTSDLWVGLDELRDHINDNGGSLWLGVILIFFSSLQSTGMISRLVVPTRKRSICFFQCVLGITTLSEAPILVLVFINSNSSLKWVSVFFSSASILFQVANLMVAVFMKRRSEASEQHRPHLIDIPLPSLEPPVPPPPKPKVREKPLEEPPEEESVDSVEIVDTVEFTTLSNAKKGTPRHLEQISLTHSPTPPDTGRRHHFSSTPLMSSRTPRMTTPRAMMTAHSSLLVMPQISSRRHSPMHTPRGYTPR